MTTLRTIRASFLPHSNIRKYSERIVEQVDAIIVGGGPAGLSCAIKLKQLALLESKELRIVVLEKGAEIGAVVEPKALNELFPNWSELDCPLSHQLATKDSMRFLTPRSSIPLPLPSGFKNVGKNYVTSLSNFVRWLGQKAEELEIEIYSSCSGASAIYNKEGDGIIGIRTGDLGISKDGKKKNSFESGMELRAPLTFLAEGCHGSLTKQMTEKFQLRNHCGAQTYGLGIKEVWQLRDTEEARDFLAKKGGVGYVLHSVGYPLPYDTYGGSWLYTFKQNDITYLSVGLVVSLDYSNPTLNPYLEFQKYKSHPLICGYLEQFEVISYGARTLVEGGLQKIPILSGKGFLLVGDAAGFLNAGKIKGTHIAMKSGMLAAESAFKHVISNQNKDSSKSFNVTEYQEEIKKSWVYKELYESRNLRPSFNTPLGVYGGLLYSGFDTLILRGRAPWTLSHPSIPDYAHLKPISEVKAIDYSGVKLDGKVAFPLLDSVSRTNTFHEEDQPSHLKLKSPKETLDINFEKFGGPEQKFCPAGVYEYVDDDGQNDDDRAFSPSTYKVGKKKFVINAQNCIHCKTCDIKCPSQNINWTTPEGSGGPQYFMT